MLILPAGKCRCQPASCEGAAQQGKGCNVSLTHLAGVGLLREPAEQGWDSRAKVGSDASVVQDSQGLQNRRVKRGDSSHPAHPAEPHRLHQLPAGIPAKPPQSSRYFRYPKGIKEADRKHTVPILSPSWKMQSDATLLAFSSLPPYPIPATQCTSGLRTENYFFSPHGNISMHQ